MFRIVFAALLFVAIPAFAAEPLVVDLWPGKTPGDVGIKGEETRRIHQSPLVGPTTLITNVRADPHDPSRSQRQEYGHGDVDLSGRGLLGSLLGA